MRPRRAAGTEKSRTESRTLFLSVSIACLSYAVLVFQIALTRIFSLLLNYHSVFAIVSGAVAGLGIGAMISSQRLNGARRPAAQSGAIFCALIIAASVLAITRLPLVGPGTLPVFVLFAIVPFVAAGFTMASIFQQLPGRMPLLYGVDLLGAAAGALTVVPLLDAVGAINTALLAALIAAFGAFCIEVSRANFSLASGGVLLGLSALFLSPTRPGAEVRIPVTDNPEKEMFYFLSDPALKARIMESRWSSFGRTDVVKSELAPHQLMIFVDGAAGSLMYDLEAVIKRPVELANITTQYGGFFPLPLLEDDQKTRAFIVGTGGGKDILAAILGGVKEITAVEVNQDVVDIARDYEEFNGGIYSEKFGVTTIVGEGRSVLRNGNELYDVILLANPVTKSSRSAGGYALTENYLFTVEAFTDYLRHLTPHGRIILVAHNEMEIYRLISLAAAAFSSQGLSEQEVMKRIYTIPAPLLPAVVVQKRPLTPGEAAAVDERLRQVRFDQRPSFVPYRKHDSPGQHKGQRVPVVDERLTSVAEGRATLATLVSSATYDISPVTDDRPFFYDLERGLPSPFGTYIAVIVILVIGLALFIGFRKPPSEKRLAFAAALLHTPMLRRITAICLLLGVGYMLIEIALFQKLMLYVGQPQRSLTVLLFSLLLGGGLGSLASSRLKGRMGKVGASVSLGIAVAVFLLSSFFSNLFALDASPQAIAACYLVPLGFVMGFPFPIAMRLVCVHELRRYISAMWGITGIGSVLGSILCMVVALCLGFSWALLFGGVTYLLAAMLFFDLPSRRSKQGKAAEHERVATEHQ